MDYIDFTPNREIEWMEFNLLRIGTPMSKSLIVSLSDQDNEEMIDSWIGELENRNNYFKDPIYEVRNNIVYPLKSWQDIPEYFLCVFYSLFGASDASNGPKLFELISAHALRNFIDGEIYAFGFPGSKNLNECLDEIADNCMEKRGIPAHSDYKDDGVDAIAYKLFADERSGNLYILLQCAAGIHWTKKKPINLGRWTNYIQWFSNNILCSISTADYVSERDWAKRVSDYGIILDRMRIYNFLYKESVDTSLRAHVFSWCTQQLNSL